MSSPSLQRIVKEVFPRPVVEALRMVRDLRLTRTQRTVVRLMRKDYHELVLEDFAERAFLEVRQAAALAYGDRWNYYSNALRREVVHTFQRSIAALAEHAERIDYLEIGSAQGLSMSLIGTMLRQVGRLGNVVSVDPYYDQGYIEGGGAPQPKVQNVAINRATRDNAASLYRSLGLGVNLLQMRSSEGLAHLIADGAQFDLIYIDGSHEGLNPVVDFGLSYALLRAGGIVMLDDHYWQDVIAVKLLCDRHAVKVSECWKVAAYRLLK